MRFRESNNTLRMMFTPFLPMKFVARIAGRLAPLCAIALVAILTPASAQERQPRLDPQGQYEELERLNREGGGSKANQESGEDVRGREEWFYFQRRYPYDLIPAGMRAAAEEALLGVRPEHIDLVPAGQGVPARVNYCEYFGSHWVVDLESPLGSLKAVAPKGISPVQGEAVGLRLHTERLVLFDSQTELLLASDSTVQHRVGMRHG